MKLNYKFKNKKVNAIVTVTAIALAIVITAYILIAGLGDADAAVENNTLHIKGMYGVTLELSEISQVTLIERSMRDIGVGRRSNGVALGNTFRGQFGGKLLFINGDNPPTIHIVWHGAGDIYISFSDAQKTRALYRDLTQ